MFGKTTRLSKTKEFNRITSTLALAVNLMPLCLRGKHNVQPQDLLDVQVRSLGLAAGIDCPAVTQSLRRVGAGVGSFAPSAEFFCQAKKERHCRHRCS